jgi:hypothetical protein
LSLRRKQQIACRASSLGKGEKYREKIDRRRWEKISSRTIVRIHEQT